MAGPTDGGSTRVGGLVRVVVAAVVLGLAATGGGYAWWHSRPAPDMSAQAKRQGAVRLTYRYRQTPNPPQVISVPGVGDVGLILGDVAARNGMVQAKVAAPVGDDHAMASVWLVHGQSAVVGLVRLTLVDVYDRPDPEKDAADVVVTAAG